MPVIVSHTKDDEVAFNQLISINQHQFFDSTFSLIFLTDFFTFFLG